MKDELVHTLMQSQHNWGKCMATTKPLELVSHVKLILFYMVQLRNRTPCCDLMFTNLLCSKLVGDVFGLGDKISLRADLQNNSLMVPCNALTLNSTDVTICRKSKLDA